ncbi:MAG: hypothetical protein IJT91_06860 [Clostridia bacterium]|nr:hypothetical protein [Clostridia bacterium]
MRYEKKKTTEIIFPIGGIGSGCVGLAGNGRLVDWEIFNRPNKNSENHYTHFAVKAAVDGKTVDTRVLHGDWQGSFMGPHMKASYLGYGWGPNTYTLAGMPHFRNTVFDGEFPIAKIYFSDEHFPGNVTLTAFNPYIPLNARDSSIPGAFFEIEFENLGADTIDYTAAFSCKNPLGNKALNRLVKKDGMTSIYMYQEEFDKEDVGYGDLTIATDAEDVSYQEAWYRAGWKDDFITYWKNFNEDPVFRNRSYTTYNIKNRGGDHCTIAARITAAPGEKKRVRFILTWNVPNNYNYWNPYKDENGKDISWKNYYATIFENSTASAEYSLANWDRLWGKTKMFHDQLFSQTLPGKTIEAISYALSVIKTPTVMRIGEKGDLYGWEGCQEIEGACEGSCTHVWNYEYVLPFLFPELERSMRDLDYKYNLREDGKLEFRMALPLGRKGEPFHACLDGQMGGVIQCYREWKICGDDEWLRGHWEHIKAAIAYAWAPTNEDKWDLDKDGILEGRCHNTLDTELFAPSSWLEGFYIAALKAAAEMADHLGDTEAAEEYRRLFANGKKYIEDNLFNGEYYFQKVDLGDKHLLDGFAETEELWTDEFNEIKYQIGEGSEIDQVVAQWHADLCGLGEIFDPERVKSAVGAMYRYNFKKTMRENSNPWRYFCLDDEAGAIICDYPEGRRKPAIPLSYAEETMHGFEYVLAALLIKNGMIDKGLEVIAGVRDRYDGEKRNPFNEIECGSNYSRNMATYSFELIFSGMEYDTPKGLIGFDPILKGYFKSIWSLGTAWGFVETNDKSIRTVLIDGRLKLKKFGTNLKKIDKVWLDGEEELSPDKYTTDGRYIIFNDEVEIDHMIMASGE